MDKKKTAIAVVKMVGGIVISIGVGAIVKNVIQATTPEDAKKVTRFCIGVGSFFITSMTAAAASKRFEGQLDGILRAATKFMLENETEEQIVGTEA